MSVKNDFMWATLVHLGSNMWNEHGNLRGRGEHRSNRDASLFLRFEPNVWNKYMSDLKANGTNTIILDIGEALFYETHPEIAVAGSWKRDRMLEEISRLNEIGFEVIPKLNFSTCHDAWLGEYSRMVSTSVYYNVCKDLIKEVSGIFKPRYFHIGMDEECEQHQRNFDFAVIRQNELWWHDLYFLVDCVESENARAWVWSDYANHRPEEYVEKMPKSVLQSPWYYGLEFGDENTPPDHPTLKSIELFEKHGFDQVPTGSVWSMKKENFEMLVKYSAERISREHLVGFMQTTWERPSLPWQHILDAGNETLSAARAWYENVKGNVK